MESTSKEKDCNPYWTSFCGEISSHLLLPVVTDSQDLGLNLYSTWSNKTVDKSWFSTQLYTAQILNSPRIYSQSFTCFHAECTDSENTLKKSRKICLSLTPAQKAIIKQWFGVSRFLYNKTVLNLVFWWMQTAMVQPIFLWKSKHNALSGVSSGCLAQPLRVKIS